MGDESIGVLSTLGRIVSLPPGGTSSRAYISSLYCLPATVNPAGLVSLVDSQLHAVTGGNAVRGISSRNGQVDRYLDRVTRRLSPARSGLNRLGGGCLFGVLVRLRNGGGC